MEILEKCIFYDLDKLVKFKKLGVLDLGLKLSDESSPFFNQTDGNYKVSVPGAANLGYFTHITLANCHSLSYQRFLVEKLTSINETMEKSALTEYFAAKKLVLLFDLNSSWGETLQEPTETRNITILRVSYIGLVRYSEALGEHFDRGMAKKSFVSFLKRHFSTAENIEHFFAYWHISTETHYLAAVIIDNISMLNIYEEPQNIELTRLRRAGYGGDEELVMVDVLKNLHLLFGCMMITTGFDLS